MPPSFEYLIAKDSNLESLKLEAQRAAYEVIIKLEELSNSTAGWRPLQIATTESLTAGLIMSTIVDVPYGGWCKYGCTAVYDTDAKRVFNGVKVDDVYTQMCAKEMAVGLLKNSNASVAISVSGNAMPDPKDVHKLGEVFIGVAGYKSENEIVYETISINSCIESKDEYPMFIELCKKWFEDVNAKRKDPKAPYADRRETAAISQQIRYYTTLRALEFCLNFLNKKVGGKPLLIAPQSVKLRKEQNEMLNTKKHTCDHPNIPANKYDINYKIICTGTPVNCEDSNKCKSNRAKFEIKSGEGPLKKRTQIPTPLSNHTFPERSFNVVTPESNKFKKTKRKTRKNSNNGRGGGAAAAVKTPRKKRLSSSSNRTKLFP
tara:strand:+ start:438 stop:1562 length:1125 start_codon:yes stop_codon:yes gene_type:complete